MNKQVNKVISIFGLSIALAAPCFGQSPEVSKLLQTATAGSGQQQYGAIDDLGERRVEPAVVVPKLRQIMAGKDAQARWRAARAIGDFGDAAQSAAADLRTLLASDDPLAQYHAAVALGKIGDRSDATVDALVKAATNKEANLARAAIASLRNLKPGPQRVMAALDANLNSDDEAVVLHALRAIVESGAEAVPLLNEALKRPKTAYLACTAIEQIGPAAAPTVPALVELLGETRHSHLQIQALLALASIGPAAQSAGPKIVPLLETPYDATVPVAAAYALGSIGATSADSALRNAAKKDNPFLQMIAAWSLAKLHRDDEAAMRMAVEKLTSGLESNDASIRAAAAKGLQMLQAPPELVAPAMIKVFTDSDPDAQANAVSAVASLGEAVVPRVAKALSNPQLRAPAVQVLIQLGPKAAAAVPALIEAEPSAPPELQAEIHFALAGIGAAAAPATGMLAKAVSSEEPRAEESALYALREIGPAARAAREPLLKRMQADDSFGALASAWALASIVPEDSAVAAQAVPKLVGGLSHDDELTRLNSVEALAAWGAAARPAVTALQRVAKEDKTAEVRAAAEAALVRINGATRTSG